MFEVLKLKKVTADRGTLIVGELDELLPYQIKRFYYLTNLDSDLPRGFHAHYECRQVAICLQGSCVMHFDDGKNKQEYLMSKKEEAITIEPYIWHEMHNFSSDCILLVLASHQYDESDYIRDYNVFLECLT